MKKLALAVAAAVVGVLLYGSVTRIPAGSVGVDGEGAKAKVQESGWHLRAPFSQKPVIYPIDIPPVTIENDVVFGDGATYKVGAEIGARLDPKRAGIFRHAIAGHTPADALSEIGKRAIVRAAAAHASTDLATDAFEQDAARVAGGILSQAGTTEVKVKLRPLAPPELLRLAQALAPDRRANLLKPAAEAMLKEGAAGWEISTVMGLAQESDRDLRGAEKSYLDALTASPSALPPMAQLVALYSAVGEYEKLDRLLQAGAATDPKSVQHFNWLALSKMRQGKLDEAQGWFDKALSLEPENVLLLNNLGGLKLKQGRIEEAEATFRRAVQAAPSNRQSLYNLGVALSAQGKYKESLEPLLAAEKTGPPPQQLLGAIAESYRKTGHPKEAAAYESRARGAAPADATP